MKRKYRKESTLAAILFLSLLLFGCSNEGNNSSDQGGANPQARPVTPEAEQEPEPVTLTFYVGGGTLTNTEFELFFEQPTKEKFPHITLEKLTPADGVTAAEVLVSSEPPDIIYLTSSSFHSFLELEALADLDELVEKHQFEVNRLKPYLVESIQNFTPQGNLFTLPFSSNVAALFYNKDIFNRFSVAYPPDEQLTWEQLLEIAAQLTRNEGGVQYIGTDINNSPASLQGSYGIFALDAATGEPILQSEQWKIVFKLYEQSVSIPGYVQNEIYQYDRDSFLVDQNLAMRPTLLANLIGPLEELRKEGKPMNWDIAPIPNFADQLGAGKVANVHSVSISASSKHKDEAFQVLANILSDEVQRIVARNGRVPAIDKQELELEFGADIEVLQGKKIENIFKTTTPVLAQHRWENDVAKHLNQAFADIALNGIDTNTALRNAEDAITKELETLKLTKPQQ